MSDSTRPAAVTLPVGFILFCIFLTLKLTDNIDWSWWWVTAPLWAPVVLVVGIILVILVVAGIGAAVGAGIRSRRRE